MFKVGDYVKIKDSKEIGRVKDISDWGRIAIVIDKLMYNYDESELFKVYRLVDLYEYYCDPSNHEDKFQQISGELSENQIWKYDRMSDNIIGDVSMKLDTMSTDYRVKTFVELIKESKIEKIRSILNTSYYEDLKLEKIKEVINDN